MKPITIYDDEKGSLRISDRNIFYVLDDGTKITYAFDDGKKIPSANKTDAIYYDTSATYANAAAVATASLYLVSTTGTGAFAGLNVAINYDEIVRVKDNGDSTCDVFISNNSINPDKIEVGVSASAFETLVETKRNAAVTNV